MAPATIDLSDTIVRGTEEWQLLGQRARKALEEYGWLVVDYGKISYDEKEETFDATRSLMTLPIETKLRHASTTPSPYYPYIPPSEASPYYESFGFMNAGMPEKALEFTRLMWPDGNDKFRKLMSSMSNKMLHLVQTFLDAVCDSYGVDMRQDLCAGNTDYIFRLSKYTAPMRDRPANALPPHIDSVCLTVLFANEVEGLSVNDRNGNWSQVTPGKGSLVLFVGQALRAWSNGRLHAPLHKVTIGGDKDRLMSALFLTPKGDAIIQPHHGFVDKEHPAIFKPFVYQELLRYSNKTESIEGTLETFAGI